MSFFVIFFVLPILESPVKFVMFKISEEAPSSCGILAKVAPDAIFILGKLADESWPRLLGSDSFSN